MGDRVQFGTGPARPIRRSKEEERAWNLLIWSPRVRRPGNHPDIPGHMPTCLGPTLGRERMAEAKREVRTEIIFAPWVWGKDGLVTTRSEKKRSSPESTRYFVTCSRSSRNLEAEMAKRLLLHLSISLSPNSFRVLGSIFLFGRSWLDVVSFLPVL